MAVPPEIVGLVVLGGIAILAEWFDDQLTSLYHDMGPLGFLCWLLGLAWMFGWPVFAHRSRAISRGEALIGWLVGIVAFESLSIRLMRGHARRRQH